MDKKSLTKDELEQALVTAMVIAENALMMLLYSLNEKKIDLALYSKVSQKSAIFQKKLWLDKAERNFATTSYIELGKLKCSNNIYFTENDNAVEMSLGNKKLTLESAQKMMPSQAIQKKITEFFDLVSEDTYYERH